MAAPNLVNMEAVSKGFGTRTLLDSVTLGIGRGERAGVVGRNGDGKSTLLQVLARREEPDSGRITHNRDLRLGYLGQSDDLDPGQTVLHAVLGDVETYTWAADPRARSVMEHLLGEVDHQALVGSLSGGERRRASLARLLLTEVDLLVLDEPTNHLDIETVEWLEDFLVNKYGGALLLVAHDQYLMDNLATKVLEIDDKKVWEWEGNFTQFQEQKEATLRALEARRKREMDEFKRQLSIIEEIKRRNRFDHQAQSKQTRLEKMKSDAHAAAGPNRSRGETFKLQLRSVQKSSNDVLVAEDLTKRFGGARSDSEDDTGPRSGGTAIFERASFSLGKGDRVGLIGPNGTGKTTLLRMIMGLDKPTSGRIEVSPGVKIGFFDQEHAGLVPGRTLIDEVRSLKRGMGEEEARGLLGRFLFKGDEAFKTVEKLSGGEKARMALLKFLVGETNLLILDEPTNHLDLASQRVVEDALAKYDGTLLVVSHDRHFLDAVVNKIAVVANRQVGIFPGNFSETRTLTKLQEFMGSGEPVPYVVRKSFRDYESGRRYTSGETILVTGGETQTTKRLFRLAIERDWMEPKD